MPLLLLVDGSSYLYRAYHALPDLRNPAGEPTGAIYGMLGMLRRLEADYKADYKAIVFDAKGKTFRHEWFSDYKSHRPPMPDDLVAQAQPIRDAVCYLGWPLVEKVGVEADDVIGTLTHQAVDSGLQVLICTGDKDMAQLVCPQVQLINTMNNEQLDVEGVKTKFGVAPERFVDYLTLIGDKVDNIPGVEKCGPKTAVKWLSQFGDLDNVVANAEQIGGVVGENLRQHLDFLPLGKKLVQIRCDLSLDASPLELVPQTPNWALLSTFAERYNLKSLYKESLDSLSQTASKNPNDDAKAPEFTTQHNPAIYGEEDSQTTLTSLPHDVYETILDEAQFDSWLQKIHHAPITALDTETTSKDPFLARLVGISLAVNVNNNIEACYIPLMHNAPGCAEQLPIDSVLDKLQSWLEADEHLKLGQNLKYDQHVLANHGMRLHGIAHDTLLESYVLESNQRHDLDQLAKRHLGVKTIAYSELCGKGAKKIGFEQVDLEKATAYAAEDADATLRIHQTLWPQLEKQKELFTLYSDIEIPVRQVLFEMERVGIQVNTELLSQQSHELGQKLLVLEQQAFELAGQPFNLNSTQQLAEILFVKQGLPIKKKTPGGAPSTNESVLSELALDYPLPKCLLQHRSLSKLKNTYTDKLPRMVNPETGRVHTNFSQSTVVTGRLASSDPNLQNIPIRTPEGRRIREAFNAPQGCQIVSADYSQIELRIMAHLSSDTGLLQAFSDGMDIHKATAAEVFGCTTDAVNDNQRRIAKSINFGLIYGMSAFGLARQLGIERSAAQSYIDRYFARYPGVALYMERTRKTAQEQGYVNTVFGRRLWFPDIRSLRQSNRQAAERAAINAPMQGTAADLIKLAMIAVHNWLKSEKMSSRLVLQVHDELVLEVPDHELEIVRTKLPEYMAGVATLQVPLLASIGVGNNWDEAH